MVGKSRSTLPLVEAFQTFFLDWLFLLSSHDALSNKLKTLALRLCGARVGLNLRIWRAVWIDRPAMLEIGDNVTLGRGVMLICGGGINIGDNAMIGHGAQIISSGHSIPALDSPIKMRFAPPSVDAVEIGADVWIGAGAIILPGVRIGAQSVVGAGAIVTKDLPGAVIAVGNPARVIGPR